MIQQHSILLRTAVFRGSEVTGGHLQFPDPVKDLPSLRELTGGRKDV